MPTTCKLIAKNVLGSDTASVSFSSIPSTNTDLWLVCSGRADTTDPWVNVNIGFNAVTTSFSGRLLEGNGSSASSYTSTRYIGIVPGGGGTSSTFGSLEIYIPNYAGSTNKSFSTTTVGERNNVTAYITAVAGLWSNTSAITSVELSTLAPAKFVTGSSFFLYGITKA